MLYRGGGRLDVGPLPKVCRFQDFIPEPMPGIWIRDLMALRLECFDLPKKSIPKIGYRLGVFLGHDGPVLQEAVEGVFVIAFDKC